ncbi:MAG: ABC-2 transporter permease [Oscillospiraceae bacterium]|nr:ABC-2 transporter permease [Oscillospiraceae bacterium]
MKSLLDKELRLAVSPLTWLFLAASLMTLIPGYPILMGSFFICLGIFQSFQSARETNDMLYTALLPVRKADVVKARFIAVCFFELLGFAVMAALTALRMTVLGSASPYLTNPLMNANPVFLAFALLIFSLFNLIFVAGFFKSGYKFARPFLIFIIAAMLTVAAAEFLTHLPALAFLRVPSGERVPLQCCVLLAAAVLYAAVTFLSERSAERAFELIDL